MHLNTFYIKNWFPSLQALTNESCVLGKMEGPNFLHIGSKVYNFSRRDLCFLRRQFCHGSFIISKADNPVLFSIKLALLLRRDKSYNL